MVDSWEELRIKNRKRIPRLIVLFFILIMSGIFIFNNLDFFYKKPEIKRKIGDSNHGRTDSIMAEEKARDATGKDNIPRNKAGDSISSSVGHNEKNIKPSDTSRNSVELYGIKCMLADKDSLTFQVSLKLSFQDEKMKSEILLKRDDCTNSIKKIIGKKKLSDIVINTLRVECKLELNKLLKKGKIDDIEFVDFRPLHSF